MSLANATGNSGIRLDWVPVSAAAEQLGVTRQRVYVLLRSGKLGQVVMNGTVLVSQRTVDLRNAEMGRSGM